MIERQRKNRGDAHRREVDGEALAVLETVSEVVPKVFDDDGVHDGL
jgi:hypothetical protein